MRLVTLICCAAALVGCAKPDTPPADTTTPVVTPPPPRAIALSDVAGKWNVKGMNEAGDSTLVTYVLTATADTTGWTITFPNRRRPVPVHVGAVAGDSIIIHAGPYESVLRPGVQVRTTGAFRLQDGKIVGMTTARYSVKTADSVRLVRTEGTRAP